MFAIAQTSVGNTRNAGCKERRIQRALEGGIKLVSLEGKGCIGAAIGHCTYKIRDCCQRSVNPTVHGRGRVNVQGGIDGTDLEGVLARLKTTVGYRR